MKRRPCRRHIARYGKRRVRVVSGLAPRLLLPPLLPLARAYAGPPLAFGGMSPPTARHTTIPVDDQPLVDASVTRVTREWSSLD